jgi:hypothetical protein
MTITAMSVTPAGATDFPELPPKREDYLKALSVLIGCSTVDGVPRSYPRDSLMMWFDPAGPGALPLNPVATSIAANGRPIHGTVVFTGPCTAGELDITPLSPRCVAEILGPAGGMNPSDAPVGDTP